MDTQQPQSSPNPIRIGTAVGVAILALILDLTSKEWVWNNIRPPAGKPVEVISGLFYLKFGFNTGSAFSLLAENPYARELFIGVTFLALIYLSYLAWRMPSQKTYGFVAIGLIGGGAIGNLHDRFVRTMEVFVPGQGPVTKYGVVDFLQFYYPWDPERYWPIFNIADSALVCGVALLMIYMLREGDR